MNFIINGIVYYKAYEGDSKHTLKVEYITTNMSIIIII